MISAILLSAGLSQRFGSPKALAQIGPQEKNVISLLQDTLINSAVDEIIVVLGDRADEIKPYLLNHTKLKVVYNKDYKLGQTSSFKTGLREISGATHGIMLFPIDCPLIKKQTINTLIDCFVKENPFILIPVYESRKGHPPIFNISLKDEILGMADNVGLNVFQTQHQNSTMLYEIEDAGILQSFNTPEEFEALKRVFVPR